MSIEEGIATTLNLKLGDRVSFDVAGEQVSVRITSLRKVDWDSFRVNFSRSSRKPRWHLCRRATSPHSICPSAIRRRWLPWLTLRLTCWRSMFPEMMARVRSIVDQVARALEFVFAFTLLAGLLTLYTAVIATGRTPLRHRADSHARRHPRPDSQLADRRVHHAG